MKRYLLIDADILLYQACDHCLQEHYNRKTDEYSYRLDKGETITYVEGAISAYVSKYRGSVPVMCFTGTMNFRKYIDPMYKAHRTEKKPLGYLAIKKELLDKFSIPGFTSLQEGLEADDLIGIYATTHKKTIIVSSDKDMATIPGKWWNPDKEIFSKTSLDEANRAVFTQAMTGDSGDGYKGAKQVGPVAAKKVLEKCTKYEEMWNATKAKFESIEEAVKQIRMAHILRAGMYDFKKKVVKLWMPPETFSGDRTMKL
jgi:DNA polymerase-1